MSWDFESTPKRIVFTSFWAIGEYGEVHVLEFDPRPLLGYSPKESKGVG